MMFRLEIELGNDAMRTYADIAASVKRIFADFARRDEEEACDDAGRIYDANGNRVGTWEVSGEVSGDDDEGSDR